LTTLESRTEFLRAQLQELYGLQCIPMWGTPRNLERKTYGGKAAKFAEALGTPFMPWQRYVADVVLEVDPYTGLLAYREVLLMVPRQSGKTTLELAVMAWRASAWPRQNILYSAQTRNDARKKWEEDHVPALLGAPSIAKRIRQVVMANGRESIKFHNRSTWGIVSNTEKAGHGPTLDMGLIDEGFSHEDDRMEQAFSPAMITRPQPQTWLVSTAGTAKSLFLNDKRELGREVIESGEPSRMAVFDWTGAASAKEKYDRTDRRVWRRTMPALGHTITEEDVAATLASMQKNLLGFDRAFLNITRLEVVEDDPNVPSDVWPDLVDEDSRPGTDIALAIDVTPSRDYASISSASLRPDGKMHLELIDHRSGTDWVAGRAAELVTKYNAVGLALDLAGPAGSLLIPLEKLGIRRPEDPAKPKRRQLAIPTVQQVAAACADFTDAARNDLLRHADAVPLNVAVAGARSRPLGDGGYGWGRKSSGIDISPLVATTLARWVFETRAHLVKDDYDPLSNIW
jgi:hypothetical protein